LRSVVRKAPTLEGKMSAETILASVVTVLLLVYLFYTLLRPEKF
jgi:K+-transporting ATPase KdpF subunit